MSDYNRILEELRIHTGREEPKGFLGKAADVVTGRGQYNPNIPEISESGVAGVSDEFRGSPMRSFSAGRLLTDDDQQMRNIIRSAFGEKASFVRDTKNNVIVELEDEEGEIHPFYINRPGLSMADVERLGGQLGSFMLGGRFLQGGGMLRRLLKGGAVVGAVQAGRETGSALLGGGPPDWERAALTGALGALGVPVGDAVVWGSKSVWAALKRAFARGPLSAQAVAALRKAGIDPDEVTPSLRSLYRSLETKYGQEGAVSRIAEELTPEDLRTPLTAGERTWDIPTQQDEFMLESGMRGPEAQATASAFRGKQDRVIEGATIDEPYSLLRRVGTGTGAEHGASTVQSRLAAQRQADYDEVQQAYKVVEGGSPTQLMGEASQELFEDISNLSVLGSWEGTQIAQTAKASLETILGKPNHTINDLFAWRRELNQLATPLRVSDPTSYAAAMKMVERYDAAMDRFLDRGLMLGDPNTVRAWQQAIKSRKQFGKNWQGTDRSQPNYLVSKLTDEESGLLKVDPEEAANFILNTSDLGFMTKANLNRGLNEIKTRLGADSQEWAGIADEVMLRFIAQATKVDAKGAAAFVPGRMAGKWSKFRDKNSALADTIFTKDEQKLITRWLYNAAKAGKRHPLGENPSKSAVFMRVPGLATLRSLGAERAARKRFFNRGGRDSLNIPVPYGAQVAAPIAATQAEPVVSEEFPGAGRILAKPIYDAYGRLRRGFEGQEQ